MRLGINRGPALGKKSRGGTGKQEKQASLYIAGQELVTIPDIWKNGMSLNSKIGTFSSMPFPMGKELQIEYGNDFRYVVMASFPGENILSAGTDNHISNGIFMDVDAPKMLMLQMREGDLDGLKDPHSILLSASTAKAIFGSKPAVGKVLTLGNKFQVKVTGVFANLPDNATFRDIGFIAPWQLYIVTEDWILRSQNEWDNNSFQTFVQLADHADFGTLPPNSPPKKGSVSSVLFSPRSPFLFPASASSDWHRLLPGSVPKRWACEKCLVLPSCRCGSC